MEKKYLERLVGKYCKVVTKEPGEERASVVTGILEDVDYKDGFILINSNQGLGCLRISTVIAIKPGSKRRIEKRKIKVEEEAMVGIGTLIVFIAMVLIAAVAASVLITTSETLQSRARTVGTATIREVSAGVSIESITGYTNVNKTKIEYIALTIRPRAGSKDIDLGLCTLSVLYDNLTILTLNESLVQNVNTDNKSVFETPITSGSSYTILDNTSSIKFGVIAIHDPDSSVINTNGMNSGDRIIIIVNLSAIITSQGGLPPREAVEGTLTPEIGIMAQYDTTAPAVFSKRIVNLS
ncbi:archaeal flagellin-like protein [Thermoplasmatales archaeon SCGC AB-540-F20]|nr:archaeal flagellin-like protein [Thermoplasmatales archaeon SCGC AB-540-F20]